ncbi:CHAT domain-containing protein [Micromonospora sp. NPDC048909]|uniref:CHAT domain-containing protein n=1 Tax=Micromonospora sp. NPDC048909 TaxID=3155643 RepID=UPI0033DF0363
MALAVGAPALLPLAQVDAFDGGGSMWRRLRSDPVRRLRERLDGFGTTMDARRVLGPDAVRDAEAVIDLVTRSPPEPPLAENVTEGLFLLACLYWYRYQILPPGQDADELAQAVKVTELLLRVAPERVPPSLLAMLQAHRSPAGSGRIPGARTAGGTRPGGGTAGSGTGEAAALFAEAVMLMGGAESTGDYRVADQAQALLEQALAVTPAGVPERLHHLSALGRVHRDQFRHLGRRRALQAAIDAHRESLESTPAGDPQRATRLFNLGNVLADRYELAGDAAALDESVQLLGDAARATPADTPLGVLVRANLGQRLRERWRRRGEPADLDRAAEALALAARAGTDPQIVALYASVAAERYTTGRDDEDLDEAIEANRAALAGAGFVGGLAGIARVSLAALLGERYERRGDPADLDAAIEAYRAAAEGASESDGVGADELWHTVGKLLESRYQLHRRSSDLTEAVRLLRAGVAAATDPVERAVRLGDLGYTLGRWHSVLAGVTTLRESREVLTEAVRLLPAGHPKRPDLLNNLGNELRELADQAGEYDLLAPSAAALRSAVAAADAASPMLPRYLSNLGLTLQALFGRTEDLATLTEAIAVLRRAVTAAGPGHPDRPAALTNYASALNRRVELAVNRALPAGGSGATDPERDARTAVEMLREALELAPREAEPEEYARILGTFLLAQLLRYRLTGDAAALDEAITLPVREWDALPEASPDRYRLLTNLGNALLLRFRDSRSGRDAVRLLAVYRAAVDALPAGHPDRTMCLSNLAGAIETIARPPDEPDAARPAGSAAADRAAAPAGHPDDVAVPVVDLAEAATALRDAAAVESAPSVLRADAAARYAAHAASAGDLPAALDGYATAIELIDLFAWHGMDPDDQARLLARFPGLAGDAAAVAIALDRPERAVELLEYGRGVLLTRAHDAGADLAVLRERAARLADQLAGVQSELDGFDPSPVWTTSGPASPSFPEPASPSPPGPPSLPGAPAPAGPAVAPIPAPAGGPERRHELATRRRELLAEIRRLPDLAGFLRPPPFADLARAADAGPVVLVNVADRRCDALVVGAGRVDVVPLPELTAAELVVRAAVFLAAIAEVTGAAPGGVPPAPDAAPVPTGAAAERGRVAARRRITETLDWLWRVVAAPVLDTLDGVTPPPAGSDWPRLWWCATGVLTLLPLHAAAPLGGGPGVLDRVVPSYTASLRALRRARDATPGGASPVNSALVVGMPQTPGLTDLPGVAGEEAIVRRHLTHVRSLTGPTATPAAVLAALPERPVAHLSCHGTQDLTAPTRGRLALAGGPLQVRDLWRPAGTSAALAVLSACDTVRGGAALPDEALTLGTAFQLAGFRHVIGSLWSISDALTVQLCAELYAGLAVPGGIDPERAAPALHHAVRQLRAALPGLPELWAGYLHIGP